MGLQLASNSKAAGGFYSEEAARLAREAATRPQQPATPVSSEPTGKHVPPILLDEPHRPPLKPEPATNQNVQLARTEPTLDAATRPVRPLRRSEIITGGPDLRPSRPNRRREAHVEDEPDAAPVGVARMVAWIILAPWGLSVLAVALALIGLVARGFF